MSSFFNKKSACVWWVSLLFVTGCGSLGSPVSVSDRPLSERIDERNAELAATELPPVVDDGIASTTPEAIAFSDTLASGDFLRLYVSTNGVDTSLRSGPGSSYDEIAALTSGAEVLATGNQTGEWVYVVYGDFEGWVSNRRLSIGDVTPDEAVVTAAEVDSSAVLYVVDGDSIGVNMRAEPNANAELVSGAPAGSEVVGTGRIEGTWVEITFNGVTGWSSGNYLTKIGTVDGTVSNAPATDTPAD